MYVHWRKVEKHKKFKENKNSPNFLFKIILQFWQFFPYHFFEGSSLNILSSSRTLHASIIYFYFFILLVFLWEFCYFTGQPSVFCYVHSAIQPNYWVLRDCLLLLVCFLRARSFVNNNWCLCVTVRVFFKCLVVRDCVFIPDFRGPKALSENVLSSGGRAGAGCGSGRGESVVFWPRRFHSSWARPAAGSVTLILWPKICLLGLLLLPALVCVWGTTFVAASTEKTQPVLIVTRNSLGYIGSQWI